MKNHLALLMLLLAISGCKKEDPNQKFETFKEAFIEDGWKLFPGDASSVGYHKYDSVLPITSSETNELKLKFAADKLGGLAHFETARLSQNNVMDYHMIENYLKAIQWNINSLKEFEWNPSTYNVSSLFAEMLTNNYDSLDTRLHNFGLRLAAVPAYYIAAKHNIKDPSKEHTELAIAQNLGGLSIFESDLTSALAKSHLPESEKQEITKKAAEAVNAIKDYTESLKNLENKKPRSFRLGKDLYDKNLRSIFSPAIQSKRCIIGPSTAKHTCIKKWRNWQMNCGQSILLLPSLLIRWIS